LLAIAGALEPDAAGVAAAPGKAEAELLVPVSPLGPLISKRPVKAMLGEAPSSKASKNCNIKKLIEEHQVLLR
jgi:hypothetical protein